MNKQKTKNNHKWPMNAIKNVQSQRPLKMYKFKHFTNISLSNWQRCKTVKTSKFVVGV